jgi:hypothetical protein
MLLVECPRTDPRHTCSSYNLWFVVACCTCPNASGRVSSDSDGSMPHLFKLRFVVACCCTCSDASCRESSDGWTPYLFKFNTRATKHGREVWKLRCLGSRRRPAPPQPTVPLNGPRHPCLPRLHRPDGAWFGYASRNAKCVTMMPCRPGSAWLLVPRMAACSMPLVVRLVGND